MSAVNDRELSIVIGNLNKFTSGVQEALHAAAEEIAELVETYAKTHHLWKPITGQTDATTRGEIIEETGQHILIALYAETEWTKFLELARGGRFAWLWPAMDANRTVILEIVRTHLSGVQI